MSAANDRVLIAGAGPVGQVLAALLERQGIPVLVLEKEAALPKDLRAGTFHPPSLEIMAPIGFTDFLLRLGIKVPRWQFRDLNEGVVAEFELDRLAGDTPYPYRLHCEQWKLTREGYKLLRERPGIEFRFAHEVVGVAEDVLAAASEAKKRHPRPRPFQRFQLKRICGQAAPKPEAAPTTGTSYPSGHAAVSWAAALVMMETRPSEATPLIMRAVDFGHSRVVCGVHFPSDVDAGRLVAVAVIDKLFATPEFRSDLLCAKREVQAVAAGERSEDLPAC